MSSWIDLYVFVAVWLEISVPFFRSLTLIVDFLVISISYLSSSFVKERVIEYPSFIYLFGISAFLMPLEFLLYNASSMIHGMDDLPIPLVPII